MSKEYPLYPTLTEQGELEAQKIMDSFKPRIKALLDDLMGDLYANVAYHIESDSWTNFRNEMVNGFKGYEAGASTHTYDFKELRQSIYKENKEAIDKDLNKDLVEEVARLKSLIESMKHQNWA